MYSTARENVGSNIDHFASPSLRVLFNMDKELSQIMELNGLGEIKGIFLEHKVYNINTAKNVTDSQYEKMGVAIGQVATLKSVLNESSSNENAREERIKSIINSIRSDRSKIKNENKSMTASVTSYANKKSIKSWSVPSQLSVRVGWLHRKPRCDYKQMRLSGAGIRKVTFEGGAIEKITPKAILDEACRMFFPEGKSKMGALSEMDVCLGNYSHDVIDSFKTLDGSPCSYLKYLKEFGLFSSKVTFYVMTTTKVLEDSDTEREIKKSKTGDWDEPSAERPEGLGFDNREVLFNKISDHNEPELKVVADAVSLSGELSLEYEEVRESSYSEVIMRSVSTSIQQCYEHQSLMEPDIMEIPLKEYCPLEDGPFHLVRVCKGDLHYLDLVSEPSQENPEVEELLQVFPQCNEHQKRLILHPPSQLWGYDRGRLIVVVIASCHGDPNTKYIWYKDGDVYKQGCSLSSICVDQPGTYSVEVRNGDKKEASEPFIVEPVVRSSSNASPISSALSSKFPLLQPEMLPVIDNNELSLGKEIGSGTFGKVYQAIWAGTPVAVKVLKVRNAKKVSASLENEVKVHSSVRHPNIVQMMGVSYLKNSIYIVSEFVDGRNLDDILFSDDEDVSFHFDAEAKITISRQLCRAIAYLHNLKPQVIHRDIKPANIIVTKSHITKLCDMGISKFKSSQTLTTTTAASLPGTPQYMAPECLLSHKSATAASDIWSLGCTLVECFNGEDLWGEEMEEQYADDDQITALNKILTVGVPPKSLDKLSESIPAAIQLVLVKCFEFVATRRPTARDVLGALEK